MDSIDTLKRQRRQTADSNVANEDVHCDVEDSTCTATTENHQKVARKGNTEQTSATPLLGEKKKSDISNDNRSTSNATIESEKGQAIIEKVIELSRKAALAMTQDEANMLRIVHSARTA